MRALSNPSSAIFNWIQAETPNIGLIGVIYGNGMFIGMGLDANLDTLLYSSIDGITWTLRYTFNKTVSNPYSLNYIELNNAGNVVPIFAVVGDIYSNTASSFLLAYSYNGINWFEINLNTNGCSIDNWGSSGNIPIKLVASISSNELFAVPPDNTVDATIAQIEQNSFTGLCYNEAYDSITNTVEQIYPSWGTLISTPNGWFVQSPNGQWYIAEMYMNWQPIPLGQLPSAMLGNLLYAYGSNKTIAVETDTSISSKALVIQNNNSENILQIPTTVTGIAYGNGLFVVVGNKIGAQSNIFCSYDGISWIPQTNNPSSFRHSSIAYGNNKFVLFSNGSIYVSESDTQPPPSPPSPSPPPPSPPSPGLNLDNRCLSNNMIISANAIPIILIPNKTISSCVSPIIVNTTQSPCPPSPPSPPSAGCECEYQQTTISVPAPAGWGDLCDNGCLCSDGSGGICINTTNNTISCCCADGATPINSSERNNCDQFQNWTLQATFCGETLIWSSDPSQNNSPIGFRKNFTGGFICTGSGGQFGFNCGAQPPELSLNETCVNKCIGEIGILAMAPSQDGSTSCIRYYQADIINGQLVNIKRNIGIATPLTPCSCDDNIEVSLTYAP